MTMSCHVAIHSVVVHLAAEHNRPTLVAAIFGCGIFPCLWFVSWSRRFSGISYYFDAQDFLKFEKGGNRELPVSAATGTFGQLLNHYIDVVKLLITVAAASIAFGGTQLANPYITIAKLILSFSILYGVLFCALLLYIYDEYSQNVRIYTRFWYATVESLGFCSLVCFIVGYIVWALSSN
jgi:hypothetical protein